jgi:thioredoxin-dependent peroxiredoxin
MAVNDRIGTIKFRGRDVTVVGEDLQVGQSAPEFTVQDLDWAPFKGLANTQGKVRIISSLLSLSTDVCDRETRHFNEEAAALSDDIVILAISNDLPFAQKNWCGAHGVDKVKVLSDHMWTDFGEKYGVLIKETRFLRRAVFVVDKNDIVTYAAYMPVMSEEPNYNEVMEAARAALA